MSTNSGDLVDKVLNAGETVLGKALLNDLVVSQRNSGTIDLAVASLVDKLSDHTL